jgi:hypothetical protein
MTGNFDLLSPVIHPRGALTAFPAEPWVRPRNRVQDPLGAAHVALCNGTVDLGFRITRCDYAHG